jgi:hypothetical protein
MATRSTISLEFADGRIGQVYAHWDGYLAHNGKILFENYSNPFVLRDLIDLGDISSLKTTIGTKHPFSMYEGNMTQDEYANLYRDMTTFYGRDRGEVYTKARYFNDYEHFLVDGQEEEYDYILRNVNGVATWFVSDHGGDFKLLTEALAEEARELAEIAEVGVL